MTDVTLVEMLGPQNSRGEGPLVASASALRGRRVHFRQTSAADRSRHVAAQIVRPLSDNRRFQVWRSPPAKQGPWPPAAASESWSDQIGGAGQGHRNLQRAVAARFVGGG